MEEHLYGRLTTLNRLKSVRDDFNRPKIVRHRAEQAMTKIVAQLKDRGLNRLRERLIKATRAGDLYETWKIENQIRAYEGSYEGIEHEK